MQSNPLWKEGPEDCCSHRTSGGLATGLAGRRFLPLSILAFQPNSIQASDLASGFTTTSFRAPGRVVGSDCVASSSVNAQIVSLHSLRSLLSHPFQRLQAVPSDIYDLGRPIVSSNRNNRISAIRATHRNSPADSAEATPAASTS